MVAVFVTTFVFTGVTASGKSNPPSIKEKEYARE